MADAVQPEGVFGWTRLGCVTALITVLPIWGGLAAAFVHLWGKDWPARFGLAEPTSFLGLSLVTWVALAQSTALLLLVGVLVAVSLVVFRGVSGFLERRSTRASARRYEALVGDGDTLRPDSWALTDGPEPDPRPDGENP